MARFLVKTEPSTYSFAICSATSAPCGTVSRIRFACKHLATIRKGDTVIVYHTGDEKQAVGLAVAATDAYPDPKLADPKRPVVDLAPERPLATPVTLAQAKADAVLRATISRACPALGDPFSEGRSFQRLLKLRRRITTRPRSSTMCRNIKTLFNFDPPANHDEVRAASLQFVRKISGFTKPSQANEAAFERAIDEVGARGAGPARRADHRRRTKDREIEAAKAREAAQQRFGLGH